MVLVTVVLAILMPETRFRHEVDDKADDKAD
jgi:hypothetical protein